MFGLPTLHRKDNSTAEPGPYVPELPGHSLESRAFRLRLYFWGREINSSASHLYGLRACADSTREASQSIGFGEMKTASQILSNSQMLTNDSALENEGILTGSCWIKFSHADTHVHTR